MPIGISDDHVELADAFGKWAGSLGGIEAARAAEDEPDADVRRAVSSAVDEMGLLVASPRTDGGGSLLDLAVAVEACAAALRAGAAARHRGRLGRPRRAGRPGRAGGALALGSAVVHDAPVPPTPSSCVDDEVRPRAARRRDLTPGANPDLTRRTSLARPRRRRGHHRPRPDARPAAPARRDAGRRRGVGCRPVVPGHGRGVRRRARAVRQEDRRLPGDQAPVRGDARDQRVGHGRGVGRRLGGHRRPGAAARVRRARRRRRLLRRRGRRSPRTASRSSAGSGSPSSTTPTSTCAARSRCAAWSARPARTPPGWPTSPPPTYAGTCTSTSTRPRTAARAEVRERGRADRRPAGGRASRGAGRERLPDPALARAARPRRRPGPPARHRRGARARRRRAPRPQDRRLGRADDHRARQRRAARAVRRPDPARRARPGASCSASRAPAPTWPRCAPRPCATPLRRTGGWRLTGQKVWTSLAHEADWGICLARTNPDAKPHAGITYFLVDMRSEGIEVRPLRELTGEAMFNEVFLDDVFVPDDCVVGEVDGGWKLARTTLANERVAMAGSHLGDSPERAVRLLDGAHRGPGPTSAGRSPGRRWCSCWPRARRCARWRDRDPARSRAWPSWSAYAAGRTPPSSSSSCSATGSSPTTTSLGGPARAADDPVPLDRRRHHPGAAQRGRRADPRATRGG